MRSLRERLDNNEVLIGPISLIGSPIVVEIFGHLAFDLVFIDTEHAPTSPYGTELEAMIRAAGVANIPAIVRPTEPRPGAILKALNFGAQGIWVTHVQSRADAEVAAAACRYPPDGSRSAVPTNRSAKYGVEDWDTYGTRVNRETVVLPIVESRKGIQNIEEIAGTPGVDVIQFGPFDLSVDLGLPPGNFFGTDKQWVHPELEEAMKITLRACRKHGKRAAGVAWNEESAERQIAMGFQLMAMGIDTTMLVSAAKTVRSNLAGLRPPRK